MSTTEWDSRRAGLRTPTEAARALIAEGWFPLADEDPLADLVASVGLPTHVFDVGAFSERSSFRATETWAPAWLRRLETLREYAILAGGRSAAGAWLLEEAVPRLWSLPDRDEVVATFCALAAMDLDVAEAFLVARRVLPPRLTTPAP